MTKRSTVRSNVRRLLDYGRIASAVSRPGIDPRTWFTYARVDDDPDAIVWDDELGWYVDATIASGSLAGETVLCRVGADGQGSGLGRYSPPRAGALILIAVPNGDVNDECLVLRQLHDAENVAPTSVNGDTIVERDASAGQVSAADTFLAVFPDQDVDEEWRARRVTTSGAHRIHGDTLELGVDGADQPFVRGDNYADAEADFVDAIGNLVTAINTAITAASATVGGGVVIDAPSLATFTAARTTFKNARNTYLSTRIKGD